MSYIAYSSYSLVGLHYTLWGKVSILKYGEFSIAYFICLIISHDAFMRFIYHFVFTNFIGIKYMHSRSNDNGLIITLSFLSAAVSS